MKHIKFIIQYGMPQSHSHLTKISFEALDAYKFHKFCDSCMEVNIIGHDIEIGRDGLMSFWIACATADIRDWVVDSWEIC